MSSAAPMAMERQQNEQEQLDAPATGAKLPSNGFKRNAFGPECLQFMQRKLAKVGMFTHVLPIMCCPACLSCMRQGDSVFF